MLKPGKSIANFQAIFFYCMIFSFDNLAGKLHILWKISCKINQLNNNKLLFLHFERTLFITWYHAPFIDYNQL